MWWRKLISFLPVFVAFSPLTHGSDSSEDAGLEKHSLFQAVSASPGHIQCFDAKSRLQGSWANTLAAGDVFYF